MVVLDASQIVDTTIHHGSIVLQIAQLKDLKWAETLRSSSCLFLEVYMFFFH